jgi:hypothetical protein
MGFIYKISSPSEKGYVGKTIHTVEIRWKGHKTEARQPNALKKGCVLINAAIRKYTEANLMIETIFECPDEDLDFWEGVFIKLENTLHPHGYNMKAGGEGGPLSELTKQNISKAKKGIPATNKMERKYIEDTDLPKYLRHFRKSNGKEGYVIADHPKLEGQVVSFGDSEMTMEDKKKAAFEALKQIDEGTYVHKHKNEIYPGVQNYGEGYRVKKKGFPILCFNNSKISKVQRLEAAINIAKQMDEGTYVHQGKPRKFIIKRWNGYYVKMKNHPIRSFQDSHMSMEEKLQRAMKYRDYLLSLDNAE